MRRTVWALGWIVTIALAALALARVVAWDSLEPLVVLNALTLFVYLPAWLVAVLAACYRCWWLALLATAVAVAQILFLYPELSAATSLPAAAVRAPSLVLFDANVEATNPDMGGYAAQIRRLHPALVTLEEASPLDERRLLDDGALTALPYRVDVARYDPRGFVVASRYPITWAGVSALDGYPYLVRTSLRLPGGPLQLWVVHTSAPLPSSWHVWSEELAGVRRQLMARRPRPVLVVGDFNATWGNRGFRAILGTGLTDAAAARGEALEMTWSQQLWVPPLVRIDHVLTGPGLAVVSISTGPGPGSDHRDVTARVAVLPAGRAR